MTLPYSLKKSCYSLIKCKEMLINFMLYPNFTLRPLVVGNNCIECVSTYKILGVFIDSDLRWNSHVDYIYKTACKRFYSLRILRRAGVDQASMLKVYTSSVVWSTPCRCGDPFEVICLTKLNPYRKGRLR